jgi:hypothetical protein
VPDLGYRRPVRAQPEERGVADADHAGPAPAQVEAEREQPVGQRQGQQRQRIGQQHERREPQPDQRESDADQVPALDPWRASHRQFLGELSWITPRSLTTV